jgi:putative ABC transport system permease protein
MLKGSRNALQDPSSVLIAKSLSLAIFGNADPMNKVIKLNNRDNIKVAGVYEDLPQNTDFKNLKLLKSWVMYEQTNSWVKGAAQAWGNHSFQIFAQLNDGKSILKKPTTKLYFILWHNGIYTMSLPMAR